MIAVTHVAARPRASGPSAERTATSVRIERESVGASVADVRDTLRRSVCHHAVEVTPDAHRWASGGRGGSFLADVPRSNTARESAASPQRR